MVESTTENNEIDLLDLFIILLRHRTFVLTIIISTVLLFALGYFIIPNRTYKNQSIISYTKVELSVSIQPFVAQYTLGMKDVFIPSNSNELVVNNYIEALFTDPRLIVESILDSGNKISFFPNEKSDIYIDNVKSHLVNHQTRFPRMLSIEDSAWIYEIKRDYNSIDITCYFQFLNKSQAEEFISSLLNNANHSILTVIRPTALSLISNYQDYIKVESIDNVSDETYYGYFTALGVVRDSFNPLIVVNKSISEHDSFKTLSLIKDIYLKRSLLVIFVIFFFSVLIVFIIEFVERLKQNEERYEKIKNALRKK